MGGWWCLRHAVTCTDMSAARLVIWTLVALVVLHANSTARAGGAEVRPPPEGYDHTRFAPEADIPMTFRGYALSFDSADEDTGLSGATRLRVPHWVAQEVREWKPISEGSPWCLNTGKRPSRWFTDKELRDEGLAAVDDSYTNSGYQRGHMAMKLLVERLDQDAARNTFTLLNAVPQREDFNEGIWKDLECLTGAWAQRYGRIWIIQGPVFTPGADVRWTKGKSPRQVAVPDALFKIVVRDKTVEERAAARTEDRDTPEVLAFIYPQAAPEYSPDSGEYPHDQFLESVREIEDLTLLDFPLSEDDVIEERLESHRADALWEPSVQNEETREFFVRACQGKDRKK